MCNYVEHKLFGCVKGRSFWPIDPEGRPKGRSLLAVDGVQAGIGDRVLVVDEGGSARAVIGDDAAVTIRTAICGIVDRVDIEDRGGAS